MWVAAGSMFMFLAVALGAFGAHALKDRLSPDLLAVYETGVRYQVYHALGLFAIAWLSDKYPNTMISAAGVSFIVGIVLFSGSLYLLSLTGVRWIGAVTPIGGLSFLIGWMLLVVFAVRHP